MTRRSCACHCTRGLTLLEVLIATAILAVLAGAVVPSIAQAMAAMRHDARIGLVDRADLARIADDFMADPQRFAEDLDRAKLHEIGNMQIAWPADQSRYAYCAGKPIAVRSVRSPHEDVRHIWLEFTCGDTSVIRWVALPPKPESWEAHRP